MNNRVELPSRYREEVIEQYGTKLMTSGYGMEQTKKILLNGVKGYMSKKRRRQAWGQKKDSQYCGGEQQYQSKEEVIGKNIVEQSKG